MKSVPEYKFFFPSSLTDERKKGKRHIRYKKETLCFIHCFFPSKITDAHK